MKTTKTFILIFLICLASCGKEAKTVIDDHPEHVQLLWRNKQFDWVPTTLVAKNDTLYFGNLNRSFYSIALDDGKPHSKFQSEYNPFHKPLIADQQLFMTDYASDLSCFNTIGKLNWKIEGDPNLRNDLAENDRSIYGSIKGNRFSKLNKTDGKLIWQLSANSNTTQTNTPAFLKKTVYLGLSGLNAKLLAINDENGAVIWNNEYGNFSNLIQIKTQAGLLVCLAKDFKAGEVLMLDFETGHQIWSASVNCDIHFQPCRVNESLILSTCDNRIISLNIKNGNTNWVFNLKQDQAETDIVNFKENIYFGTMNRNLYSMNLKTGKKNFVQPFHYGISTPIVDDNKLYVPSGGSEMWRLR